MTAADDFEQFFDDAEPRLRRALVAAYGPERGREATAEALAYAWQHWEQVQAMDNPVGYLYRVGQSRSRQRRQPWVTPPDDATSGGWHEPELPAALAALSERERLAVVLIEGFGWTYREVAELVEVAPSSIQSYRQRGLDKLRGALGVSEDA
ncbi:MAG: sigma-70 family RNA polymerase sigma factor [Acidimicrobiia bacterium]|nr:sigma-70 family RNA polymerase sigma factor [Acidimicrobiia bacterium]